MIRRLALVLVLGTSARAFADAKADAKAHIDKASTAHAAGKLDVALSELNIAYTLDPQPELLFAIAQVHVQLGQCPQAITFYERFLATHPDDEAVAVTKQAIETCKTAPPPAPETSPTPPEPPPTPPPQPPPAPPPPPAAAPVSVDQPPFYTDVIGDALVGAGVLSGIVGVIEYASARSSLDDAEHAATYMDSQALVDQAHSRRNLAIVFEVGGLALVGAGVVHYLVLHHPAGASGVAVVPSHDGGLVTWSGRF